MKACRAMKRMLVLRITANDDDGGGSGDDDDVYDDQSLTFVWKSTMERVLPVIWEEFVLFAVQGKLRSGNSVGYSTYECAEGARILLKMIKSQEHKRRKKVERDIDVNRERKREIIRNG